MNAVAEAAYLMLVSNYLDGTLHEDHRQSSFKRDSWGGYTFCAQFVIAPEISMI